MIIQSREPDRPPVQAQVIEIPPSPNRGPVKPLPPAVFILRNGERLQAERFLLRMSAVSVTVNRQQRIIPFDLLDLDATLAINRDRGIDLRIPSDPSEITLSF